MDYNYFLIIAFLSAHLERKRKLVETVEAADNIVAATVVEAYKRYISADSNTIEFLHNSVFWYATVDPKL